MIDLQSVGAKNKKIFTSSNNKLMMSCSQQQLLVSGPTQTTINPCVVNITNYPNHVIIMHRDESNA